MLKTSLRNTGKGAWKAGLTGLLMVTSVHGFRPARGNLPGSPCGSGANQQFTQSL